MTCGQAPRAPTMKIAYIYIYKRIPISGGGDWWRFQLLADLARNNSVSAFYPSEKPQKRAICHRTLVMTRAFCRRESGGAACRYCSTSTGPTRCATEHSCEISRQIAYLSWSTVSLLLLHRQQERCATCHRRAQGRMAVPAQRLNGEDKINEIQSGWESSPSSDFCRKFATEKAAKFHINRR